MVMVKELEIMASMAPQGSTEHGSVVHMGRLGECTYGVNEVQPEVLAVTSFCGVVFSQGWSYVSHYIFYCVSCHLHVYIFMICKQV